MNTERDRALGAAVKRAEELRATIAEALAELSALQHSISESRRELKKVTKFIDQWHEMAGGHAAAPTVTEGAPRPQNPDRQTVATRALEIIRESGRPMPRRELLAALEAAGLRLEGKDPEMILSTMLWRERDRIVRLRNHGYWPKDTAYDAAFYIPEHEDLIGATETEPEGPVEER